MGGLGNKEIMSKNLKHYLSMSGKDRTVICDELGFKYSTFTEWLNGKKYPRIEKIEKMADYFGIQKSDLIEAQEDNLKKVYLDQVMKADVIFYKDLELNKDSRDRIYSTLEFIYTNQNTKEEEQTSLNKISDEVRDVVMKDLILQYLIQNCGSSNIEEKKFKTYNIKFPVSSESEEDISNQNILKHLSISALGDAFFHSFISSLKSDKEKEKSAELEKEFDKRLGLG